VTTGLIGYVVFIYDGVIGGQGFNLVGRKKMKKFSKKYNDDLLISHDEVDIPNIWTLLNRDNMSNALAISLILIAVSLCYSAFKQPTISRVSDNPVQLKVGVYDKPK
jgi:hypothetical protein